MRRNVALLRALLLREEPDPTIREAYEQVTLLAGVPLALTAVIVMVTYYWPAAASLLRLWGVMR